eukprot:8543422-Pyramimonas_sp.AAC.1
MEAPARPQEGAQKGWPNGYFKPSAPSWPNRSQKHPKRASLGVPRDPSEAHYQGTNPTKMAH